MPRIAPFEKYPKKYEDWFENNQLAYQSELLAIRKLMPENGEGIEIGVGSGKFAEPLGVKLGVEPSSQMRKIAEKKGIEVIDAVAEKLPFNDKQFDFALMVTTICFLDDIETAFKEAYRILKPSGSLIIGFVDRESDLGKLYLKRKKESVFYGLADFYSTDEVISYLKRIGFKNFDFVQTIFHDLTKLKKVEPAKKGYGQGSFVVIKADKGEVNNA